MHTKTNFYGWIFFYKLPYVINYENCGHHIEHKFAKGLNIYKEKVTSSMCFVGDLKLEKIQQEEFNKT